MAAKRLSSLEVKKHVKGAKSRRVAPPFAYGLLDAVTNPDLIELEDERIVIIKDKYPKAKYHFLVLPKESIRNLSMLQPEHSSLLKYMEQRAKDFIKKFSALSEFRFGYHAIPSMSQLHLHAISQDFISPCLKTKKHWNSFTTDYFRDSSDIINELEETGKIASSQHWSDLLKNNLRCHVCKEEFSNMPKLKAHIECHVS